MKTKITLLLILMLFSSGFIQAQIIEATSPIYSFNISNEIADKIPPKIKISYPQVVTRGFKPLVKEKIINIRGTATDKSGIFEVKVNGIQAAIAVGGGFVAAVPLVVGENQIKVKATDGKGNTGFSNFTVVRQSDVIVDNASEDINPNELNQGKGKYYALIIGVNEYSSSDIDNLDEPLSDAQKLYDVLTQEYSFEPKNVRFLKNPTRDQIIQELDNMANRLNSQDNLLIFYAGHGYWDEKRDAGYWLPSDAKKNSTSRWIRNSTIRDYFNEIKIKHTLLIADACFSGGIFKTRKAFEDAPTSINKLYELPSRKAMTSGTLKEVPDKSVFMEYLVKRLKQNNKKYISSLNLFSTMREAILNNSPNIPQFGIIQNSGDEGGDFIFIRK